MEYTSSPYTKQTWSGTTPITSAALNAAEGQWAALKAEVDSHDHDDEHYPITEADATFFSASFYTGFDADKLDGIEGNALLGSALPTGTILLWQSATVPTGWHICDGSLYLGIQTPDLRDRFVVGAEGNYSSHDSGGSTSFTPTATGITTPGHAVTVDEMPAHDHDYEDKNNPTRKYMANESGSVFLANDTETKTTEAAGGDQPHSHGTLIGFDAISAIPEYYALYFICKCY